MGARGRGTRRLPTDRVAVEASPELCFQVVASAGRTLQARSETEKVVAFDLRVGARTITTVELVTLEPPKAIHYRWLEGPLPVVEETIECVPLPRGATELRYRGHYRMAGPWIKRLLGHRRVQRAFAREVRVHLLEAKEKAEKRAERSRLFPRPRPA